LKLTKPIDTEPRIETLAEKILIGKRKRITFADNQTKALWQSFMPRRNEIKNNSSSELFSLEVYKNPEFFNKFDPTAEFEKWAAVEVNDLEYLPSEMEITTMPDGIYVVFM